MKTIDIKLPHYKQAWILQDNFKEVGIKFVYNHRNRHIYISLLAAPTVYATETGVYMVFTRVYKQFTYTRDNFDVVVKEYKAMYKSYYSNNPSMLQYLESTD